jgi:amino acid adenylation domain-containing protein
LSSQDTNSAGVGFRLSPQQEYLLGVEGDAAITQCAVLTDEPAPERGRLQTALHTVLSAHEILRTTFAQVPGMRAHQQVIGEAPTVPLTVTETDEPLHRDSPALRSALEMAAEPFDLHDGPLLRAMLVSAPDGSAFILTAAAACLDTASMLLVLDELGAAYADREAEQEPLQYADYAEWRHELLNDAQGDAEGAPARAFWREQSQAAPARTPLPATAQREGTATSNPAPAAVGAFSLRGEQRARLQAAAARAGVAESAVLQAVWHAAITRLTMAQELLLAGWVPGRSQADLQGAVGPYAQPVPIRTRTERETSLPEIVDQVGRASAHAERWADYAGAGEARELLGRASAGVQVTLAPELSTPWRELVALRASAPADSVMLAITLSPAAVVGELSYDSRAYAREDVANLARRLAIALDSALNDPGQPLLELEITTPAERAELLAGAAGPVPLADATTLFTQRFQAQSRTAPERVAISGSTGEMSYGELNAAANRLAHRLRELGVDGGVSVGLCLERSPELFVAVLGILKAGGAYVALNPEHPGARRLAQLADAGAAALVTDSRWLADLAGFTSPVVCLDRDAAALGALPGSDPSRDPAPDDLAYVMYTSGSTGAPKGVAITHANLANYTSAMIERLHAADASLRFGVVSAISTDLGNTSIFAALASGGSLHLIDPDAAVDPAGFAAAVAGHELDVLKIAPSHLRALLARETLPRRWLVLGGEALSWELVARIRQLGGACQIINHYGPTEATVGCCTYDVGAEPRNDCATVPVGFPIPGSAVYVLDGLGVPVPGGVPGELCVGGAGVAEGYIGSPALSEEKFVADPTGHGRMYRTGDRARRLRDGAIEFLGRVDDQVKVRGYRVEPGEIEAALVAHPRVRQAAVVAESDEVGGARLVGYLVAAEPLSVEELQAFLSDTLPDYMIPGAFLLLAALPLTPSGKVDRRALPDQAAAQAHRASAFVAPRDDVEQGIAAIWAELLGVDQVGVHDDFFALGGHSLLATQAIMRIRRAHGEIPLRALLAAPTVAELAEVVRGAHSAGAAAGSPRR